MNHPRKKNIQSLLPRHIAIIMDGNGRWAAKRNLPRVAGHRVGVEALGKVIQSAIKKEIEVLSFFAFSTENWMRPLEEVNYLMRLFLHVLKNQVIQLKKNNIRLQVIGDRTKFKHKIRELISDAENVTSDNTGLRLVIAANYGGHWDILQAVKNVVGKIAEKKLLIEDVTPDTFQQYLTLSDLPYPDLLIRTSGEQRISNFFLWQLAYTELYFTDILWPDFDADAFDKAIEAYINRDRRFGMLGPVRK